MSLILPPSRVMKFSSSRSCLIKCEQKKALFRHLRFRDQSLLLRTSAYIPRPACCCDFAPDISALPPSASSRFAWRLSAAQRPILFLSIADSYASEKLGDPHPFRSQLCGDADWQSSRLYGFDERSFLCSTRCTMQQCTYVPCRAFWNIATLFSRPEGFGLRDDILLEGGACDVLNQLMRTDLPALLDNDRGMAVRQERRRLDLP